MWWRPHPTPTITTTTTVMSWRTSGGSLCRLPELVTRPSLGVSGDCWRQRLGSQTLTSVGVCVWLTACLCTGAVLSDLLPRLCERRVEGFVQPAVGSFLPSVPAAAAAVGNVAAQGSSCKPRATQHLPADSNQQLQ